MMKRIYIVVELPENAQGTGAEAIDVLQKQSETAWKTQSVGVDLKEVRDPLFRFFDKLEYVPE